MELKAWLCVLIFSPLVDVTFQTDTDIGGVVCQGENSFVDLGQCITVFSEKLTLFEAQLKCQEHDSMIFSYDKISNPKHSFIKDEEVLYWNVNLLYGSTPGRIVYDFHGPDDKCPVSSARKIRRYVSCVSKNAFACVSLYSNVLLMKVDEHVLNDHNVYIRNGSLKVECFVNVARNTMYDVYITKNDTVVARGTSPAVYYVPKIKCENAGIYTCYVVFGLNLISLESSISISMPCPLLLTLSVNGEAINTTMHIKVPIDSAISLSCSVENPNDTYKLFIYKDKELSVSRNVKDVTHNLTIKDCHDTGTYTCHYSSKNVRLRADVELNVVVDNCSIHMISFNYGIASEENLPDNFFGYIDWQLADDYKHQYKYLSCNAETYSRPTNLTIRSYDGSILVTEQNVSRLDLHLSTRSCDINGKVTCELRDHLSNQTYSMETYIFREGCPPKHCHEEVYWKQVEAQQSENATVSFCFMTDNKGLENSQIKVFKNTELISLDDKMKYTPDIIQSNETNFKKLLTFTIVNVEAKDFGHYSMILQTGESYSITFTFTLVNEQNLTLHYGKHTCVFIAIASTVILAVIILANAIYFSLRKMKFGTASCLKKSDILINPTEKRTEEVNTYVKLSEIN